MRFLHALCCLLVVTGVSAEEINDRRAQFNYQLFCQGCHTPDGVGAMAVPRMKDQVGYFLATPAGREYLVRVPGSATSALSDADLAEVLNWIVREFAGASAPQEFERYSAGEVGRLRQQPLNEVEQYRSQLLAEIAGAITGE
ncbi:MAG: cytochrome c, class I [Halioglobus sp.]|jgi:cytochrome c553